MIFPPNEVTSSRNGSFRAKARTHTDQSWSSVFAICDDNYNIERKGSPFLTKVVPNVERKKETKREHMGLSIITGVGLGRRPDTKLKHDETEGGTEYTYFLQILPKNGFKKRDNQIFSLFFRVS